MEFGLFIQNYVPNHRREVDPEAEHHAIFEDLEAVIAADKAGFKFVWITEHTSSTSTPTCRPTTSSRATSPRRPSGSTSAAASSTRCRR